MATKPTTPAPQPDPTPTPPAQPAQPSRPGSPPTPPQPRPPASEHAGPPERQQALDAGIPAHVADGAVQHGISLLKLIALVRRYGPFVSEIVNEIIALYGRYGPMVKEIIEELFGDGDASILPAHAKGQAASDR